MRKHKLKGYKVIGYYFAGSSASAIRAVAIEGKPIVEVCGGLPARRKDLVSDLRKCLKVEGRPTNVRWWIRKSGDKWRFGFYKHPWALRALDFLSQESLSQYDRSWISGLLFGYQPEAIQRFIEKKVLKK